MHECTSGGLPAPAFCIPAFLHYGAPSSRPRRTGARPPRRHQCEHEAILRFEVGACNALHVLGGDVLEDVELTVGRLDVVVNHDRVRELQRLRLIRLAPDDVVAGEPVFSAPPPVFWVRARVFPTWLPGDG